MAGGKLLLVDDEPAIREPFAQWLRAHGYEVAEAADGVAGLARARQTAPHVALLDVMMPRMTGWDLCRELKYELPATRIVMLTAIGPELNKLTAPSYGADAFHDKPFEFRRVDETIQRLMASGVP